MNIPKKKFLAIVLLCIIYTSICFTLTDIQTANAVSRDYWPTNGWQTKTPEEVNISSVKLQEMHEFINETPIILDSLLLVRSGYLVDEIYNYGYNVSALHPVFSVTKSIISALIGIAINEGYLTLDQKMVDFFSNRTIENLDVNKQNITIEHLLTMSSGISWIEPIHDTLWFSSENHIQYVLDRPMTTAPGNEFNYNTGATHLLSAILQNVTGRSTLEYCEEKIFTPLGIANYSWSNDPQGVYYGGVGISLLPRDMAKIGFLYLNNGTWDGQQIVPKEWVRNSTTPQITVDDSTNYGYLWWLYPKLDVYVAQGFNSQLIYVYPKYDLVVVTTAQQLKGGIYDMFENYLLPALNDFTDLPTNESAISLTAILFHIPVIVFTSRLIRKKKQ